VLATVPDFWPHLQAAQTNFSVPVLVPNVDCKQCILQGAAQVSLAVST
jgi:hypothetical protein